MKRRLTIAAVLITLTGLSAAAMYARRGTADPVVTTDKVSRGAVVHNISASGSIVATAMLLMPLTTPSPVLSLLALALWASGTWFGIPAMQAIVAAHSDRLRGTMLAFNTSAFNLAGVVGPVIMGTVITAAGFGAAFLLGSALVATALGTGWLVLPRRTAEPASVASA